MLIWFRWHYDKKLLRNIDDDEFLEFSAKCPERQAVMVGASRQSEIIILIHTYIHTYISFQVVGNQFSSCQRPECNMLCRGSEIAGCCPSFIAATPLAVSSAWLREKRISAHRPLSGLVHSFTEPHPPFTDPLT